MIHDYQVKVCRLCLRPDRILKDCLEFQCFYCKEQGHYKRDCTKKVSKCRVCYNKLTDCICFLSDDEGNISDDMYDRASDSESVGSDEQNVVQSDTMQRHHFHKMNWPSKKNHRRISRVQNDT